MSSHLSGLDCINLFIMQKNLHCDEILMKRPAIIIIEVNKVTFDFTLSLMSLLNAQKCHSKTSCFVLTSSDSVLSF